MKKFNATFLGIVLLLVGCTSKNDMSAVKQEQNDCKSMLPERYQLSFAKVPCLTLPISSKDYLGKLPTFKNGIIDIEKAKQQMILIDDDYKRSELEYLGVVLGIIQYNKKHTLLLHLSNSAIEGGESAQVFELIRIDNQSNLPFPNVYPELGYYQYYFNKDELIKKNIDPNVDVEIALEEMADFNVEDVFAYNFYIDENWVVRHDIEYKNKETPSDLIEYFNEARNMNKPNVFKDYESYISIETLD
ncbi:hypothetical protein [Acinetobacter haemolyticus]|uniref:hypothetical protein n=1 Tax=Acinetobacter haemolyticus TaxID=29430 RepID=UPI002DBF11AD|nr:hypothetical protein [Acinetobacter haemolyticus]MEB6676475.1 hypothetical protein [Acinetobacter haemolyticus]